MSDTIHRLNKIEYELDLIKSHLKGLDGRIESVLTGMHSSLHHAGYKEYFEYEGRDDQCIEADEPTHFTLTQEEFRQLLYGNRSSLKEQIMAITQRSPVTLRIEPKV